MSTKNLSTLKVTAVVYSAKGLKPKKKDKHKFCVIFGVGACKYRTEIVEDLFDNPVFNTECDVDVDDVTSPLTFFVTEKHDRDILGQVTVPLSDLTSFRTNRQLRRALQPHKKCPNAVGELVFEAWISAGQMPSPRLHQPVSVATMMSRDADDDDHKASSSSSSALPAGLRKLKDRLTTQHSPTLHRKSSDKGHKRTNSDGTIKLNMSTSCQDLTTVDTMTTTATTTTTTTTNDSPRRRSLMVFPADTESLSSVDYNKPEVTGVSPKEGSTEGGTRLTIRGSNLGRNKEDVIGLCICGSNVLSSLEYFSSSKVVCVTKAHKPCSGTIVVETQTGGRGVSLVQFTFIETSQLSPVTESAVPATVRAVPAVGVSVAENYSDSTSEGSSSLSRSSSRGDADMRVKRQASVKSDSGAGIMSSSVKTGEKARSMFDLTLPHMASSKLHPPQLTPLSQSSRPEVTGVSPREGPANSETKLTIRGSNLGQSASDIVSLSVAGVDCIATLDYDSPTRLTCVVGPTTSGPAVGDVIVATKSGGVGISMVQFRFVDAGGDEDQFTAVPYDAAESLNSGTPLVRIPSAPAAAEIMATSSPFQRVRQAPPVVEIQPMMSRSAVKSHGKSPAPPPPESAGSSSPMSTGSRSPVSLRPTSVVSAAGMQLSNEALSKPAGQDHDIWLNEKIAEMSSNLAATEELVRRLQHENKLLRDENERMRQYMECLVSKAIATCPQILCVDTSKLF